MNRLHQVYRVFGVYPSMEGDLEQFYLGKFWKSPRRMAVLEDRQGILGELPDEAPLTASVARHLSTLASSGYLRVVSMQPSAERQPGVPMDDKDEDLTLAETVANLRRLVATGDFPAESLVALEQALFCDEIVPRLGNLRSYRDHLATVTSPGAYVELAFDFPSPHDTGARAKRERRDVAERVAGDVVRRAVDDVLGKDHREAWHTSGPQFVVFATNQDAATAIGARVSESVANLPHGDGHGAAVKVRAIDAAVARARGAERG